MARSQGVLAAAEIERRVAFVFMRDLERAAGLGRGDPRFQVALGRAVAHELEHVGRGTREHDALKNPERFTCRRCSRERRLRQPRYDSGI